MTQSKWARLGRVPGVPLRNQKHPQDAHPQTIQAKDHTHGLENSSGAQGHGGGYKLIQSDKVVNKERKGVINKSRSPKSIVFP